MDWRRSGRRISTWSPALYHKHGVCNQWTEEGVGEGSVLGPLLFIICIEFAVNWLMKELEKDWYLAPCSSSYALRMHLMDWRLSWRRISTWPPALHHLNWVCSQQTKEGVGEGSVLGPLLFIICIESASNRLKKELEKDQYLAPCSSSYPFSLQSMDSRRSERSSD